MSSSADNYIQSVASSLGIDNFNTASIPQNVANGNTKAQQAYGEGLAFEQVLVNQLTTQLSNNMSSSAELGSDSDSSDSSNGMLGSSEATGYSSLISGALTSSIMSDGGMGMADEFAQSIDPSLLDGTSTSTTASETTAAADGATGATGVQS